MYDEELMGEEVHLKGGKKETRKYTIVGKKEEKKKRLRENGKG